MYDYIIVGAGSAGCVLAARLSEDPDVGVLLLEAGPADTCDNIHIPLGVTALGHRAFDWDYSTGCEPNCDGRRIHLPPARAVACGAAGRSAARPRPTRWFTSAASPRITTAGATPAAPDGDSRTCSPTS